MAQEITAGTRTLPRVEEREVKIVSLKAIVFKRFIRHRMAVTGVIVVALMVSFAFVGPFISPYQPDQVNLRERFAKPSIVMVQGGGGQPHLYNADAVQGATGERPLRFG